MRYDGFVFPAGGAKDEDDHLPLRFLDDEGTSWWMDQLEKRPGVSVSTIGRSRAGRPLYGLRIGDGPLACSITAGAHADEPAGPIAACLLAWEVSMDNDYGRDMRRRYSFYICPQVNPDGSEANKAWFAEVPDIQTYLQNVARELPGDDIEFGYPATGQRALRPENEAVAGFLRHGGPYHFHASLHSMAMAEGAWFLIEKSWADRSKKLQEALGTLAAENGFKLHDIQRNGDKGFHRIRKGFCTTPTSTAMKEHFLSKGDKAMAAKFMLSSMEFIASLGNDPFCLVTEIPAFALKGGWTPKAIIRGPLDTPAPEPGSTAYEQCRAEIQTMAASGDFTAAEAIAKKYDIRPVPFSFHAALQAGAVSCALRELQALQQTRRTHS